MHPLSNRVNAPTPGTRMAMWLYPLFTLFLGLTYVGPPSRLQVPTYTAAAEVMPMWAWGLIFIAVAVTKMGLILGGSYRGVVIAGCAGAALYTFWAFMFFAAVMADPRTPLSAPGWPIAWALAHVAFLRTMAKGR